MINYNILSVLRSLQLQVQVQFNKLPYYRYFIIMFVMMQSYEIHIWATSRENMYSEIIDQ